MGFITAPPGIVLSPNLGSMQIDTSNRYSFAMVTRGQGIWVWRNDNPRQNLLDLLPPEYDDDRAAIWGAPMFCWRPTDQQLIMGSVTQNERSVVVMPVPGVYYNR